jgi:signal transduction histidine kinase
MDRSPTKVAIVGAGKGGIALLELLHQIPDVDIVGITDKDPAAPGLQRARDLSIQVTDQVPDLIGNHGVNLILDVTGDPHMQETILSHKEPGAEVLHGPTAKLLWNLIQHESKLETELFHAEKLAGLGSFAAGIAHDINNPLQLILGLAENLLQEKDIKAVQEQAREIIEAVKRTSAICRDLTRYARRNADQEDSPVNLNQKLDEALKIARYAVPCRILQSSNNTRPMPSLKATPTSCFMCSST